MAMGEKGTTPPESAAPVGLARSLREEAITANVKPRAGNLPSEFDRVSHCPLADQKAVIRPTRTKPLLLNIPLEF